MLPAIVSSHFAVSAGESLPDAASVVGVPPPMPLSRPPGARSGPNGSQIRACRSRQPAISRRTSAMRVLKLSMVARCS